MQRAEADREPGQGHRHHGDGEDEEDGARERHLQHVTARENQPERDDERGDVRHPVFHLHHLHEAERRHAHDPEPFAFERELRIDEARGERGEIQRARAEVQERDEVRPEGVVQLLREVAQVEDVNGQQAEEHERLRPLRGVAPEHPEILHHERAHVRPEPAELRHGAFGQTETIRSFALALFATMKPFPTGEDAGAALHRGRGVIEEIAHLREGKHAKERDMAEQHEHEEPGREHRAIRPLKHARREPVAGDEGELGETRS